MKNLLKNRKDDDQIPYTEDKKLVAKKDFVICQNEYLREIKKGDDLSDVPERFLENLKTEGVL